MILLLLVIAQFSQSLGAKEYSVTSDKPCFSYKANLQKPDSTVCRPDGYFAARQCSGNMCWCAKDQGQKIKDTYFKKNKKFLCQNVRYYVEYRFDPSLLQLETTLKIFSEESKILESIRNSDFEASQWEMFDVAQIVKEDTDKALLTMTLYGYNTKLNEVQVNRAIRSGFGLSSKNKDLSIEKNYDSVHSGQCPVLAECNKEAEVCYSDSQCANNEICCQTKCNMRCIRVENTDPQAVSVTSSQDATSASATTSPSVTDKEGPTESWYVAATGTKETSQLPGGSSITEFTDDQVTDFSATSDYPDQLTEVQKITQKLISKATEATTSGSGTKSTPESANTSYVGAGTTDTATTGSDSETKSQYVSTRKMDVTTESIKEEGETMTTRDMASSEAPTDPLTDAATDPLEITEEIKTTDLPTKDPASDKTTEVTFKSLKISVSKVQTEPLPVTDSLTDPLPSDPATDDKTEALADLKTTETSAFTPSEGAGTEGPTVNVDKTVSDVIIISDPTEEPTEPLSSDSTDEMSEGPTLVDDSIDTEELTVSAKPKMSSDSTDEMSEGPTGTDDSTDKMSDTTDEVTTAVTEIEITTEPITGQSTTQEERESKTSFTDITVARETGGTDVTADEMASTDESSTDEATGTGVMTTYPKNTAVTSARSGSDDPTSSEETSEPASDSTDEMSSDSTDEMSTIKMEGVGDTTTFETIAFSEDSTDSPTESLATDSLDKVSEVTSDPITDSLRTESSDASSEAMTDSLATDSSDASSEAPTDSLRTDSSDASSEAPTDSLRTDSSDASSEAPTDSLRTDSSDASSEASTESIVDASDDTTEALVNTKSHATRETSALNTEGGTTELPTGDLSEQTTEAASEQSTDSLAFTSPKSVEVRLTDEVTEGTDEVTEALIDVTTEPFTSSMSQSECEMALSDAMSKQLLGDRNTFEPACLRDGSYAPQQCDKARGICWCVNKGGEMIKNSQRFGIANCNGEEATTEQPFTTTVMKSLCWTKYTESLREQQYNPQVQIPSCEAEGQFTPSQCHRSHCWCVDQQTGVMINGTTKAGPVNCTLLLEGVCPNFAPNSESSGCDNKCDSNAECYGSSMCCNTQCGRDCILPQIPSTMKEGACPVPQSLNSIFLPEACKMSCRDDSQCGGEEKCCFTGCGYMCSEPTFDTKVYCPKISSLFKGSIEQPLERYSSEDSIKFSCNYGYQLQGHSEIKCSAEGAWEHELPVCKRVSCGRPAGAQFLIVQGNDYYVGGIARYSCYVGYTLVGSKQAMCTVSGLWENAEPTPPKCQRVSCPNLGHPKYGRIYGTNRVYGARVGFRCNYGYTLVGSEQRTCMSDGAWSGAETVCVRGYYPRTRRSKVSSGEEADGLPCQFQAEEVIDVDGNCVERVKTVSCACGEPDSYEAIVNVKCSQGSAEYIVASLDIGTTCSCCP